ncbi:amino acid adenylation domain-containing protein [Streptomyces sp. NPDC023838]|uniref:amino acid adenylation domain-containing protein n=1 Tax=Streptomyces sp. NPDC023838 TaxID=3154325 RepID=UPI0033D431A5
MQTTDQSSDSLDDVRRRIEQLPPAQRARLWQRMWERGLSGGAYRADEASATAPSSFTQRRMVVLHETDPDSAAYNSPAPVALHGTIRPTLIEAALNDIVRRHAVLRTSLPIVDGEPVQHVAAHTRRRLVVVDLSGLTPELRAAESDRLVRAEQGTPFDLRHGPLVRFHLVLQSPVEALLLTTFHHAIVDGWSFSVFAREFAEFYAARLEDRPATLPPLRLQYADYARWQNDWLETEEAKRQQAYWVGRLAGATEQCAPPPDHTRTATVTRNGEVCHFLLPPAMAQQVHRLAVDCGGTPFMVLLAAFQAVLARFTGHDDVLVGTPVANRRFHGFHDLIGFFVNSLIIRSRPHGALSFAAFLAEVRDACLAAYDNQDVPVDVLARLLYPERQAGRNPLYQVNLAFHNTPETVTTAEGLVITPLDLDHDGARFDLDLVVLETEQGMECSLIYAADLYERSTAEQIADSFQTLLTAALAQPGTKLEELPILTRSQTAVLLADAAGPELPLPADTALHHLFERQAARTPDATAVSDPAARDVTYRELDRRANGVAHLLRAQGVRRGDVVGVLLDRSADAVGAILGVLKAGAAFLPLDTGYPTARSAQMIASSGAAVVLTSAAYHTSWEGARAVLVSDAEPSEQAPAVGGDDRDGAYVIYTSGSTGTPKGILIAHRQVANYLLWAAEHYRVAEGDGAPLHSSLGFDLTITTLFAPLLCGQRIVVADDGGPTAEALLHWARRAEQASFVKLTPSHLRMLSDTGQSFDAGGLVIGGEMLHGSAVLPWLAGPRRTRLFNEYGPTEASVACTVYEATADVDPEGPVPIGRPIGNTRVHVLDDRMRPVPRGVAGELYIGGVGVAYGYLGQGGQTAERFVPDPFGGNGGRLYRTGDSVVVRADGELVYLGRRDRQVKVRGHRIEPDEIAATLAAAPGVRQAVVDLVDDRLTAFVEPADPHEPADSPETAHLAELMERVEQWRMLYTDTYQDLDQPQDSDAESTALTGWTSSYTGKLLDPTEMGQWLDETAGRIAGLGPRRVLEIGAGTGMIVERIAPGCESYRATDFAQASVDRLRRMFEADGRVECEVAAAHEAVRDGDRFDVVVINSVLQYFPSVGYLLTVLDRAVGALETGGRIFLGDVRNQVLQPLFRTSVRLFQAPPADQVDEIRARVAADLADEEELCLDPRLFDALRGRWPRLSGVRVLPRTGGYDNELSRYRYDAVLTFDGRAEPDGLRWDWSGGLGGDALAGRLAEERPERVTLRGVPNRRLASDRRLLAALAAAPAAATAGFVTGQADGGEDDSGFGEELVVAAAGAGYDAELSWAEGHADGAYDIVLRRSDAAADAAGGLGLSTVGAADADRDAVLRRAGAGADAQRSPADATDVVPVADDWRRYANDPLWRERRSGLVDAVADFAADRLPTAMRPARYVLVRSMPLTAHGKFDLAALRRTAVISRAGAGRAARSGTRGRPLTVLEARIAAIWEELLGLDGIGADDDFFELGGHSLLTFQVLHRLRKTFGVEVPTRTMFERRTLAELATVVAAADAETSGPSPAGAETSADPGVLSFAQERLWFLHQLDPASTTFNVPLFVALDGPVDVPALARAVREVADRHDILRTVLKSHQGRPFQRVLAPGSTRLVVIDPAPDAGTETDALLRVAARRPFDLAREPALRAWLLRRGPDRHVLMLLLHHIAYDGWSAQILFDEITARYAGEPLPLLRAQYSDFARSERGQDFTAHRHHWRGRLAGILDLPTIPLDRPRPARSTGEGAALPFQLPPDVVAGLRVQCSTEQATLFMALLAGSFCALHATTGQTDAVVGIDVANRPGSDAERLVGFFVNQLVVRAGVSGEQSLRELLRQVRDTCIDAYAYHELPFEQVVRLVNPPRSRNQSPLFQLKLSLNAAVRQPALPGVTAGVVDVGVQARADLSLNLEEHADGGISGVLEYAAELFEESSMAGFLGRYLAFLEALAVSPGTLLGNVEVTTGG